jgi:hypothetical protein
MNKNNVKSHLFQIIKTNLKLTLIIKKRCLRFLTHYKWGVEHYFIFLIIQK